MFPALDLKDLNMLKKTVSKESLSVHGLNTSGKLRNTFFFSRGSIISSTGGECTNSKQCEDIASFFNAMRYGLRQNRNVDRQFLII